MAIRGYRTLGQFLGEQKLVRATLNPSTGLPAPFRQRMERGVSVFDIDETMTLARADKQDLVREAVEMKAKRPNDPSVWDAFHASLGDDKVNPAMEHIFRAAREDHSVVMLTARGAGGRDITIDWLRNHDLMPDALITRPLSLDGMRSADYKERMIRQRIPHRAQIKALYDDDPGVLEMASRNPRIENVVQVKDHIPSFYSTARDQLMKQKAMGADGLTRIQTVGRSAGGY